MLDKDTDFTLTDFRYAGFLLLRGARFLGTSQTVKGETLFHFDRNSKPEELLTQYPGSVEYQYDAACKVMHGMVKYSQSQTREKKSK